MKMGDRKRSGSQREKTRVYEHPLCLFRMTLRAVLKQRNVSQVQLAARIGKSTRTINMYLTGDRTPSSEVIAHIANALGITPDVLSTGNQQEKVRPQPLWNKKATHTHQRRAE